MYQMNLEEMTKIQTILTSMMEGNPGFSSSGETLPKDFSAEDLGISKEKKVIFMCKNVCGKYQELLKKGD